MLLFLLTLVGFVSAAFAEIIVIENQSARISISDQGRMLAFHDLKIGLVWYGGFMATSLVRRLFSVTVVALVLVPAVAQPGEAERVICTTGKDPLEQHAAQEFIKYVGAMTSRSPELQSDVSAGTGLNVSIGRSPLLESLLGQHLPEAGSLEGDSFLVKSVNNGGMPVLVLLGGSPRGTLYAVYHYLESVCKIGFFWDGEKIPKMRRIPFEGLTILERPRFTERQYLLSVVYGYTTYWWGWKEWEREIDWAAKHRFNILHTPPGAVDVWKKVWKDFGVDVSDNSLSGPPFLPWASFHLWDLRPPYSQAFQDSQAELRKKMVDYGRRLGMKWDSPSMAGIQVPKEFHAAYKSRARFMEVPWHVFAPAYYVHPDDPLFIQLWQAFMKEYQARYGTDHIWWAPNFFEMKPGADLPPDEQLKLKLDIARKTVEATKAVDPEAVMTSFGWTFTDKKYWPKAHVKAFLEAYPDDSLRVWDLWNDYDYPSPRRNLQPLYKDLDYYFGKPWLIGFLHSFGGNLSLHGNIRDAQKRIQEVTTVPEARNCRGISVQMEVIHHNHLYYDFLSRMGWNPDLDISAFLDDYAVRRYGEEPARQMRPALQSLLETVYTTNDNTTPLYMRRLGIQQTGGSHGGVPAGQLHPEGRAGLLTFGQRAAFLPGLRKALEIALAQSRTLGSSPLYQHDLIDIARQYLGDLFNLHVTKLYRAFETGDRKGFESEAKKLQSILSSQEQLLSSSDYFCLTPVLDAALALPGAPRDYDQRIKDILTVWADGILDYARRDYFELVKFYYRPRIDAFISHLSAQMGRRSNEIDQKTLEEAYGRIEQSFVRHPLVVKKGDRFRGTPVEAAKQVVLRHRLP